MAQILSDHRCKTNFIRVHHGDLANDILAPKEFKKETQMYGAFLPSM